LRPQNPLGGALSKPNSNPLRRNTPKEQLPVGASVSLDSNCCHTRVFEQFLPEALKLSHIKLLTRTHST
jgi:hypothetical protein